jgi:hypothetical protein
MARTLRVLVVTLGLVSAGAIFGAVAGAVGLTIAALLTEGFRPIPIVGVGFAAVFGAVIGAVAAPIAGWLLLRRVPLGRAVTWCVFGAVMGGVVGWTLGEAAALVLNPLVPALGGAFGTGAFGAITGFLIAAIVLRRQAASRPLPPVQLDDPAA